MRCGHLPEWVRRYIRRRSDSRLHPVAPQSAARPWWLPARLICTSVPKVPPERKRIGVVGAEKGCFPDFRPYGLFRCVVQQNVRTVEIEKMR